MATRSFAVFETAIGWCGVAWGANGITGVQLPEATEAQTRTRMARRFHATREEAPPADVRRAIDGIVAQLRDEAADFSTVELDMEGVPAFHRRVYGVARAIAPGVTMTYGDVAMRLEAPRTAQIVGCRPVTRAGRPGVRRRISWSSARSACRRPEPPAPFRPPC